MLFILFCTLYVYTIHDIISYVSEVYLLLLIYSFCPILVNKDCQLQAVITQALSCESTVRYLSCCMSHPSAHKTLVSVPFSALSSPPLFLSPVPFPQLDIIRTMVIV